MKFNIHPFDKSHIRISDTIDIYHKAENITYDYMYSYIQHTYVICGQVLSLWPSHEALLKYFCTYPCLVDTRNKPLKRTNVKANKSSANTFTDFQSAHIRCG